jgi:hypothetical protein
LKGFLGLARPKLVDDHAAIGIMPGTSSGGIYAAKTNNDWEA